MAYATDIPSKDGVAQSDAIQSFDSSANHSASKIETIQFSRTSRPTILRFVRRLPMSTGSVARDGACGQALNKPQEFQSNGTAGYKRMMAIGVGAII